MGNSKLKPRNVVVITDLQEKTTYKKTSLAPNAIYPKSDIFMVSEGLRHSKANVNQKEFEKTQHEKKVLKLEKRENTLDETQSLLTAFAPYLMESSKSSLNITKFHAEGLFKFPA